MLLMTGDIDDKDICFTNDQKNVLYIKMHVIDKKKKKKYNASHRQKDCMLSTKKLMEK